MKLDNPSNALLDVMHLTFQESELAECEAMLSPAERQKAAQFHFQHLRNRYIFAHGMLRMALAKHLNTPANNIAFKHSKQGKPCITHSQNPDKLHFNLSHSEDQVLIGISENPIGVDVECHNNRGSLALAERFFAPDEINFLRNTPQATFQPAFYWIWTRKEATLKCKGLGLSAGLDTFSVLSSPTDMTLETHQTGTTSISIALVR